VFAQFPFVDVAFGPGQVHKLAEFLTSDSLTAQGFFEFEGFTGPPADASAPATSRRGMQISVGCNMSARTASCPRRAGARCRAVRELVDEAAARRRRASARSRCSGRTSTPTGATCVGADASREFSELLRAIDATGVDRVRYTSPHPKDMREDVIRCHAELARCASTSTCRCSRAARRSSRRCAAPTRASATSTASRSSASTCPTSR
jgi:tRNA-2-methylthio-N6-dimethylallyladenosine synthase